MDVIDTKPHPRAMPSEHILETEVALSNFVGRTSVSVREFLSYAGSELAETFYDYGKYVGEIDDG